MKEIDKAEILKVLNTIVTCLGDKEPQLHLIRRAERVANELLIKIKANDHE